MIPKALETAPDMKLTSFLRRGSGFGTGRDETDQTRANHGTMARAGNEVRELFRTLPVPVPNQPGPSTRKSVNCRRKTRD